MNPIGFSITNPVKISVGVILIIMAGLLALGAIPIQLTPNVDQPVVSVTTRWEGASPSEIESDIVREQEDKLKTIEGLTKMSSVSQQGQAQVILEFPVTMDKNDALREVSEKLRQVPDYPDNVDEPVVEASDPRSRDYIAWVILSTEDESFDVRQLQKWAEDNIETSLERIIGVSEVNVLGGAEPEMQVQVDPRRMAQLGIQPGQLVAALQTQNVNISAGEIAEGKFDTRVRAVGEYERTDQIEQTIVSSPGEPVVRVRDVARVELTYKEPDAIVRSRGERSLAINAQREVGSNVMEVMNAFRAELANLNANAVKQKGRELGLSAPLTLEQVFDQTVYIHQAIALVRNNLFVGGSLAVMVLLLFLRSVRATGVIALAIPISIIGTFVVMVLMGRNLNVISLAGLAFAVGMVVDNAIVVLENIDRHLGMGKKPRQAAYDGAKEVWGAILASTLTTLRGVHPRAHHPGRGRPVVPGYLAGDLRGGDAVADRLGDGHPHRIGPVPQGQGRERRERRRQGGRGVGAEVR
jgi:HAE1 family hydrophobic/amphiphilic exporter-1